MYVYNVVHLVCCANGMVLHWIRLRIRFKYVRCSKVEWNENNHLYTLYIQLTSIVSVWNGRLLLFSSLLSSHLYSLIHARLVLWQHTLVLHNSIAFCPYAFSSFPHTHTHNRSLNFEHSFYRIFFRSIFNAAQTFTVTFLFLLQQRNEFLSTFNSSVTHKICQHAVLFFYYSIRRILFERSLNNLCRFTKPLHQDGLSHGSATNWIYFLIEWLIMSRSYFKVRPIIPIKLSLI